MNIMSLNALDRALAAKFEQQSRKSSTQEYTVVINPALGAKFHKRTFSASTQEEANLKAKKLAQEIFDQECKIQFVE